MSNLVPTMIEIPAGWSEMGADDSVNLDVEPEEEGPVRRVWLPAFEIQESPVSVGEWFEFLEASGYSWPGRQGFEEGPPAPASVANFVSWHDGMAYAEWLSLETGRAYTLPTEFQWEKACRGSDGRLFPWGDEKPDWIDILEFMRANGAAPERYQKSATGCRGMWCTVAEWCLDWYDGDEFWDSIPLEVREPRGPVSGKYRVLRGGHPYQTGWPRCTRRGFLEPETYHEGTGFRLVRNL